MELHEFIKNKSCGSTYQQPVDNISAGDPCKSTSEPCKSLQEMTLFTFWDQYAEQSPGDAALWMDLFIWAEQESGIRLAEILQGIRAKGAVLERSQQFGYAIKPVYGAAGRWSGGVEYGAARQELMQYQGSVIKLLRKVREAYP